MSVLISDLDKCRLVINRQMWCNSNKNNDKEHYLSLSGMICLIHLCVILIKVLRESSFELNTLLKIRRCSIKRNVHVTNIILKCRYFHCFYLLHFVCNKQMLFYMIHMSISIYILTGNYIKTKYHLFCLE